MTIEQQKNKTMLKKFNVGDTIIFPFPSLSKGSIKRTWTKSFIIGMKKVESTEYRVGFYSYNLAKWRWGSFPQSKLRITRIILTEKKLSIWKRNLM